MKQEKVTFLKEKQIEKQAQKEFEFVENVYAQNPIKSKFLAFQQAKKKITLKDLF